jgi:Carboxypeptidase regulatory-like domain
MRPFVLLALLAVPASLASQGPADEPGIYGYVLAPDGIPVSDGTVVYSSPVGLESTSIDRGGRFHIPGDRARLYRVTVSVPGFAPHEFRVSTPASTVLRLPPIHLGPATYFRVRFVSPSGEPIASPVIRRRSFDGGGAPILDAPDANAIALDADGATRIGPLPHGITALALDLPIFAQTRIPNVSVTGADAVLDGGTIAVQPGSTLQVDLLDASGKPVPDQLVLLEDLLPLSPLEFPWPVQTNAEGRATFERLAAGRYRVRTVAVGRCVTQLLSLARTVTSFGTGIVNARIVVAGTATFRVSSPAGPVQGIVVSAGPDHPAPASPGPLIGRSAPLLVALSLTTSNCRGTTDAGGRVTLSSFPPGPSDIAVHFANSLYVRRVDVPIGGGEIAVSVPDGFLPVHVINAATHEPVPRAFVTWTIDGGGRSEATTTIIGEALLEGVGVRPGILTVTAPGFQATEEHNPEPPGILHDVALVPLPDPRLAVRVVTASGVPLPNAVVEVASTNPLWAPQLAVTDAKGAVTFSDAPTGTLRVTATANGHVASTMLVSPDKRAGVVLTLLPGYRAVISVERPAASGSLLVRVLSEAGQSMDSLLDSASDRAIEPPAPLSLGPLPPGDYVIELRGARERRQERIRIVDRDVVATFR